MLYTYLISIIAIYFALVTLIPSKRPGHASLREGLTVEQVI